MKEVLLIITILFSMMSCSSLEKNDKSKLKKNSFNLDRPGRLWNDDHGGPSRF